MMSTSTQNSNNKCSLTILNEATQIALATSVQAATQVIASFLIQVIVQNKINMTKHQKVSSVYIQYTELTEMYHVTTQLFQ